MNEIFGCVALNTGYGKGGRKSLKSNTNLKIHALSTISYMRESREDLYTLLHVRYIIPALGVLPRRTVASPLLGIELTLMPANHYIKQGGKTSSWWTLSEEVQEMIEHVLIITLYHLAPADILAAHE